MNKRILFIGDPHIKPDNGDEIDILLHEIERVFSVKNYDVIVIGGDVMHYHERLFTQALNKALEFIRRLSSLAFTYILVGNHDAINNSIFLTDQHWMNALKTWDNVKIVDTVVVENNMILCPYVPPGRFIEALEIGMKNYQQDEKEWKKSSILFAHQEFKGCKMGAILSEDGDEWNYNYPPVVSGHIHDFQKVGENVYYPGSPLQHSFGDSDQRVLCEIEVYKNDTPKINFLPIHVPVRKIIKATTMTLQEVTKNVLNRQEKDDKIKIKLESTTEEFSVFKHTKEYKDLIHSGVKIQLVKSYNKKDNKNEYEKYQNEYDFEHILEDLIKNDEEQVYRIYNELFLDKLVIEL